MKRSASKKARPAILPWLSARSDSRERRFVQVGNSLFFSPAFQALGPGAKYLYLAMALESGGRRSFLFPQSAGKKYGISPSSLRRHIRELSDARFIRVCSMKNLRQPNRYDFDLGWKLPDTPRLPAGEVATYRKSGQE